MIARELDAAVTQSGVELRLELLWKRNLQEIVVVEGFEFDLGVSCLHDLVKLAVLLARDEVAMFVGEFKRKANLEEERLRNFNQSLCRALHFCTHFDHVQLGDHLNALSDFTLKPVKLKAVGLEHHLGA